MSKILHKLIGQPRLEYRDRLRQSIQNYYPVKNRSSCQLADVIVD